MRKKNVIGVCNGTRRKIIKMILGKIQNSKKKKCTIYEMKESVIYGTVFFIIFI